jgi:pimeloyl-ACP methyl ester carboxylesterase
MDRQVTIAPVTATTPGGVVQIEINESERLSLHYEVTGEGPDVLLVHGLGLSSMKTWRFQIPALARRYRVHAYDVRGFGQSNNPSGRFSVQQHVHDLDALMRAIDLPKAIIIGFSMGGWIAQQFVLDHPERVRALVLSCTTSGLRPEGAVKFVERAARVERVGMQPLADEQIRNTFDPKTLANDPALIAFYRENFLNEKENPARSYASMFRALSTPNLTPQLSRIHCPTMVLCGGADNGITRGRTATDAAEILQQGIPGATLSVIPDGGHYAHLEQPQVWNDMVLSFLDGLPPS